MQIPEMLLCCCVLLLVLLPSCCAALLFWCCTGCYVCFLHQVFQAVMFAFCIKFLMTVWRQTSPCVRSITKCRHHGRIKRCPAAQGCGNELVLALMKFDKSCTDDALSLQMMRSLPTTTTIPPHSPSLSGRLGRAVLLRAQMRRAGRGGGAGASGGPSPPG